MRREAFRSLGWSVLFAAATACGDGSGPGENRPATIERVSDEELVGKAGGPVSDPPSVLVKNSAGNPLAGATVTFTVTSGGGSVTGATQTTNASGIATVGSWTLGSNSVNVLQATTGNLAAVTFTALAVDPCIFADELPLGSTISEALTASDCFVLDAYYTDYFHTALGNTGAVRFSMTSATFDTFLEMYQESGDFVAGDDDSGTGTNATLKVLAPPGDYFVGASSSLEQELGTYSLTAQSVSASLEQCEHAWVVPGIASSQSISSTDCVDSSGPYYSDQMAILLSAGQTVTITMSSSAVDAYLNIYDTFGDIIATDDDGAGGTDARIVFTAPEDDAYLIDASAFDPGDTGAYTLSIQ